MAHIGHMYGADPATAQYVKQRVVPWGVFAVTESGAPDSITRGIYKGAREAVSAGFPEDGVISFFRAGRDAVGQANSNVQVSDGKFDWPLEIAGLAFKIVFPRSIVDGSDLRAADGVTPVTDPFAARMLASRYTRFFELVVNNTMLIMRIAEDEIARVPLEWIGSGVSTHVEGLSISSGETAPLPSGTSGEPGQIYRPSVSAFSCSVGTGKKDLWSLGEGALLVEQQSIEILTITDSTVVDEINRNILRHGYLYEDARIGIRLKVGLFGDRTKQANYGAM